MKYPKNAQKQLQNHHKQLQKEAQQNKDSVVKIVVNYELEMLKQLIINKLN